MGDEVWGEYALVRDPQYARIQAKSSYYIQGANDCGETVAEDIRRRYPGITMGQLAEELGLKIEDQPPFAMPGYYLFAEFEEPNIIHVSDNILDLAGKCVEKNEIDFLHAPLVDHLLAHEIFHYLEQEYQGLFTRTEKVDLFSVGPFHHTSGIRSLGEIAGMKFTQKMLQLEYSPFLMDILLLYPKEPEAAKKLYDEIILLADKKP